MSARLETDALVSNVFAELNEAESTERLTEADTAFASVNDMAALSGHPHLRRITVETPSGQVAFLAPAPIVCGEERRYGPVPALGATGERP